MKVVRRVFAYLYRYPWMAVGTLTCALAGTLMVLVFPKMTQEIIDGVIRPNRPDLLWPKVALALAAFFLRDFLNSVRIILNNTFEQKVLFDLRSDLYEHIQKLPLAWFDNRSTGDLMTRILEDVTSLERMLIDGIEQGVVAILQIVLVAGMLFYYSVSLGFLALAPIPFLLAGALIYTLTAHGRYRLQRRASSDMNSLLHDNLAGIRQIKTYVREHEEHLRFNAVSDTLRRATLVVMRVWALYSPSMSFLASCGMVLTLAFGTKAVLAGSLQVGELTMFLLLVGFLYEPIGRLHQLNQMFQAGRAAGERVFEIMDQSIEPVAEMELSSKEEVPIRGDVRFSNIGFSYSEGIPVLTNVNLHVVPGNTVALVGHTGAGKTTLVNLLTRFYEYSSGEIFLDGRPLREFSRAALREAIGMVTQESFLFNGTIRDNLRLGRPQATEEQLRAAVEAANAAPFIDKLPDGLDSVVGERGVKLSVGEKQRVSIARALLKDPPILVLDEATASVDTQTERLIQEALERLMQRRTSFVIAHRLSTVRHADEILVMESGRIVQRGKHEALLARSGIYADLCAHNFLEPTAV